MLHMNTNLVCAPGFEPDGGEGKTVFDSEAGVMSDGAITALRVNDPFDGAAMCTGNRRIDYTAFRQRAGANGTVFAVDFAAAHLLREDAGGELMSCEQHKAGGVTVEPTHGACNKRLALLCKIIRERIGRRVVVMTL